LEYIILNFETKLSQQFSVHVCTHMFEMRQIIF